MGSSPQIIELDDVLSQQFQSLNVSQNGQVNNGGDIQREVDIIRFQFHMEMEKQRLHYETEIQKLKQDNGVLRTGIQSFERIRFEQDQREKQLHGELEQTREALRAALRKNYALSMHLAKANTAKEFE